jgi:hypothetical protein
MIGFEVGVIQDSTGAEKLEVDKPDGRQGDSKEPIKEVLFAGVLSAFCQLCGLWRVTFDQNPQWAGCP